MNSNLTNRIAVIGGTGFIGASVYKTLKTHDSEVIYTSRSNLNRSNDKNFIKFDLFNKSSWETLLNEFKPNVVICTAWETEHDKYWDKNTNHDYMKYTIDFAESCLRGSVEKFIGFGSMAEYGFSPGKCNSKYTSFDPQDVYSESKVLTSIALDKIAHELGKKVNWVRLFQVYGVNEKRQRLVPRIIVNLLNQIPFTIKFPEHHLDFTYLDDVSSAIKVIAHNDIDFSINIGTGVATSVRSLCLSISKITGYDISRIKFLDESEINERIIFVDPDYDVFNGKWKFRYNLLDGLAETYKLQYPNL
jgi:nucleoside-diphosphate-sugar epimerase